MAIYRTFHQRQKELRGDVPDVFTYDTLPRELRVQLIHIFKENIGSESEYDEDYSRVKRSYRMIVEILRKELGVFTLPHKSGYLVDYLEEFCDFLLHEQDVEKALSAVELGCRIIENVVSQSGYRGDSEAQQTAEAAIAEVNSRFKQHGIGYLYESEIIRLDSEYVHSETVRPVLTLLRDTRYAGAEDEFRKAFEHYRKGHFKEALAEAAKSLESTMKSICTIRGWSFAPTDTAKNLIDICLREGLIPQYWLSHFAGVRSTLEGGVPTARNRTSGHGQGAAVQSVPDHLVSYVLHMTASTILFLVSAEKALEPA